MFIGTVNATLIIWWPRIQDREWTWLGKKEKHAIIHYHTKRKDCWRIMGKLPSYKINLCILVVSIHYFLWTQRSIIHQQMDTDPSIKGPKENSSKWTAGKLQAHILINKIIQIHYLHSTPCVRTWINPYTSKYIIRFSKLWGFF